jgi:membrane-bound metal-dependent hydrolase YbcI (DUF457 family)
MNGDEHFIGSLVFNLIFWILTSFPSIGMLLVGSIGAVIGGAAPDLIEPATWPGHRGIFHWLGVLAIFPVLLLLPYSGILQILLASFFLGYFSHFILDYI